MSYSTTSTATRTFTLTHARHLAAKVATDLKRLQRFYFEPSNSNIAEYEIEITELLKYGYLESVRYGFKRDNCWIEPTLCYTASELEGAVSDDPGKIRPGKDVSGASFYSFLTYSATWVALAEHEKSAFEATLPFTRGTAEAPGINGYLDNDRTYAAGGRALVRSSVRSYS